MAIFEDDTAVRIKEPGVFETEITDNWSINGNPNGGYLMAILAGAMMHDSDKRSTPIVTANYIARCVPGPAEVHVEEISSSAQFNRYSASLIQDGREKIRALATFTVEKTDCAINRYETGPPELEQPDLCVRIPVMPKFTLFENIDMRLDPANAGWMQGKTADISEQKGWVKFKESRAYDLLTLLLIADSIPPAIFASQGPKTWVPTIELSTNVRNMPSTEWLRFILRTRFVTCGLLEADGEVWDDNGGLVSFSRQIAQLRVI